MSNADIGRNYVLSVSTDAGTTFDPVGGIKTKELSRENPVADTTNQADTGNETSSCFTGYGTVSISGGGVTDIRTASLYAYKDLVAAANSSNPVLLFKLEDSSGEAWEGNFIITSFSKTGEQNGVVEFSISLQNEGTVTFTAGT